MTMEYLNIAAQVASILTGLSLIVFVFQLTKEMRGQNLQALFYLHQYLSQDEFSLARYKNRTELCKKHYTDWSEDEKKIANKVCASYDQAGLLISLDIMNKKTKKSFLKSSWGISICDQYRILEEYLNDKQTPNKTGRDFFYHFSELNEMAIQYQGKQKWQK